MILARYYNRNPERFTRCGITMDDLEQEGFFAVLEAVEAFNPSKGWKFTSWLNYPLQNHVNAILGTRNGQAKHIPLNECSSLDEPISQESDDMTLGDSVEDQTAWKLSKALRIGHTTASFMIPWRCACRSLKSHWSGLSGANTMRISL